MMYTRLYWVVVCFLQKEIVVQLGSALLIARNFVIFATLLILVRTSPSSNQRNLVFCLILVYRAPNSIRNRNPSVHKQQECSFYDTEQSYTKYTADTAMFEPKRTPFLVDRVLSALTVIHKKNTQIHYDTMNANNMQVIEQYTHLTSIPCCTPLRWGKPVFFRSIDWNPEPTDPPLLCT